MVRIEVWAKGEWVPYVWCLSPAAAEIIIKELRAKGKTVREGPCTT